MGKTKTKKGLLIAIAAIAVLSLAVMMVIQLSPEDLQAKVSKNLKPVVDLSYVVSVGDSITAGYHMGQHDGRYGTAASENFTTYLTDQAGVSYVQTIIEEACLVTGCTDPSGLIRFNGDVQSQNLAVPGASLNDALNTKANLAPNLLCTLGLSSDPDCSQIGITEFILGYPDGYNWSASTLYWAHLASNGYIDPTDPATWPSNPFDATQWPVGKSQIETAEQLNPSTVIIWIGNNDVLGYATGGGEHGPTELADVTEFEANYNELVDRAKALNPSATFVANIPSITSIPHFFTFEETAAFVNFVSEGAIPLLPPETIAGALGVAPDSLITLTAFSPPAGMPSVTDILGVVLTGGTTDPLYPGFYLDATEIEAIESTTDALNEIIKDSTKADNSVKLLDINKFFNEVVEDGVAISTEWTATSNYGDVLFDADGVHPSPFGHALIANEIIKLINKNGPAVAIPEIDLYEFAIDHGYDPADIGDPIPPKNSKLKKTTDMLSGKKE